ncbi:hypothetical protein [Hyalangium versicolor]|uniref:hypothetical protein n=1 Tax=Hyalangium versicolor TaxID=2861190 RepID=UPI001CCB9AAA|nr:hypothetical protein [Hyalangium versicolor]
MSPRDPAARLPHRLSLLSVLILACQPPGELPQGNEVLTVGSHQEALVGNPSTFWPTSPSGSTDVPVCWLVPGLTTEKEWVRTAITAQWDALSSVRFTGWGTCDSTTPASAIRIDVADQSPYSRRGMSSSNPSMLLNLTFAHWSENCNDGIDDAFFPGDDLNYCIRAEALKMFGYALGFTDGYSDACPDQEDVPENSRTCQEFTEFDFDSVLYPYYRDGVWSDTLSPLDVQGLRRAYGVAPFEFRSAGSLSSSACISVDEPGDTDTWSDNYFCSAGYQGIRWSYGGPIAGQRCTQILEPSDIVYWNDNYLCVPPTSPIEFTWSFAGPIAGQRCTPWLETSDPHGWDDNYLCFTQRLVFSNSGKVAGYHCTQILEPNDPDTWNDNWLCSENDEGLRFSSAGAIPGLKCTLVNESVDTHGWNNNYVCVPGNSSLNFQWSSAGPIPGKRCVPWMEPADPQSWSDNYLCY